MREFDELCLTPVRPLRPQEIRALRLRERASQAVFARYLNVTMGLVSQWERGEKRPQGPSLKLLTLCRKERATGGRVSGWPAESGGDNISNHEPPTRTRSPLDGDVGFCHIAPPGRFACGHRLRADQTGFH
jgi:hypothetical protein